MEKDNMQIVAQLNVYNSELYLWQVLKSIYGFADRIVIIDGSFKKTIRPEYSTDKTSQIVEGFDDKDNKIVYIKTFSESQNEQRSKVFEYTKGMDWLMIVDDDEILVKKDLKRIRKHLENTNENCFRLVGYNFVNSFDWYYQTENMRIWKIVDNMVFIGSNSIELTDNDSYFDNKNATIIPKVIRYHYSYVRKPSRLAIKQKQTREYQSGHKFPWVRDDQFVHRDSWKRKKFHGCHPTILKGHPCNKIKWEPKQ
jgi:hypothetical protein